MRKVRESSEEVKWLKNFHLHPQAMFCIFEGFPRLLFVTTENRMTRHQLIPLLAAALVAVGLPSCSSLRLEPADFGWPVESALTVSSANTVEETRYGVTFNVAALAREEFEDTSALIGTTLNVLQSTEGYYFVTGPRFEHVYIFAAGEHKLSLESKVRVMPEREKGRNGLRKPALNQRPPYVELLDDGGLRVLLSSGGTVDKNSAQGGNE